MPPRRSIRDEDWERIRPTIRKLYLEEDRSLKDVLLILGTFHSFYPSKAQLEWKLKQWHFTKNMGVMDWKFVGSEIHRRKCRGKGSKVYLSGIPLRTKAIERGISRYCYETAIEKATRYVPEPPMPEDQPLLVCTPTPEETDWRCKQNTIPWLLSKTVIEDFAVSVKTTSISYASCNSSCEGLVASILFPHCEIQSYTEQLRRTYQRLRLIMPEDSERGHAVRAQDLLQTVRSNTTNAEFLVGLVFLLSNNLLVNERTSMQHEPTSPVMHMLIRLFRESDGLFREAVKVSDLGAVELLLEAGIDVNTSFRGQLRKQGFTSTWHQNYGTALQRAAHSNHPKLLRVLLNYGADTGKIDIDTISEAWLQRKTSKGSPEETMRILLSIYRFRSQDEAQAVTLLFQMSYTAGNSLTEIIIEFFASSFCESSPAAKSQLLITSIRTDSRFIGDLIAGCSSYVNSCGYCPETPMTAAAYRGDIHLCKQLLRIGAIFEPRHEAATPLQWAASFSDVSMVQQLLNEGADVNFCHPRPTYLRVNFEDVNSMRFSYRFSYDMHGSLGRTALQSALLGGNTASAIRLLAAGAVLVGGELVMAIWNRQFQIIGSLLDRGASFQDDCTLFGTDTTLEAAILSENTDLVHQVIAADERSVTGQALCASICLAKATDNFTIVRHLLKYTFRLLASDETWVGTAICLAVHLQCMEIPHLILSSGLHPETAWSLQNSGCFTHQELMKSLLSTSAGSVTRSYLSWRRALRTHSPDHQPTPRRPIFEIAVSSSQLDFLKLLVDYGYHPGPTSSLGLLCSDNMDLDILQFLHSLGIKMPKEVLANAITCAASEDNEIVRWLLSVGVDFNEKLDRLEPLPHIIAQFCSPSTPLQQAVRNGWSGLIQQLIEFGADINEHPSSFGTALQHAAECGHFGIVQSLLELGANPNASGGESPYSRTAIESAAEHGRLDVVQLLLNSGVETGGFGRRQYVRSVDLAEREGHHTIVRLLKSHAGWTDADEDLLCQKDLIPVHHSKAHDAPAYVRCYYGDKSNRQDGVVDVTVKEDRPRDQLGSNTEVLRSSERVKSDSEEHASNSGEISQALAEESLSRSVDTSRTWPASDDTCCRVQEPSDELDEPSETFLSRFDPISNLPDAYEALSEEVGLEFLPSSISYQIREELEGDGCLEESGDNLWAEEYSRFVTELV